MTQELKKDLLKEFKEMLEELRVDESLASDFEHKKNENGKTYWRKEATFIQQAILKSIENLIEKKEVK